jgi:hypothetical protein
MPAREPTDVCSKVQKLLALAADNPSSEEGSSAAVAASKLVKKHNLRVVLPEAAKRAKKSSPIADSVRQAAATVAANTKVQEAAEELFQQATRAAWERLIRPRT